MVVLYEPITAQLGDVTYSGEWALMGRTVRVVCEHGAKTAEVGFWSKPGVVAERVLIPIFDEAGRL